MLVGTEDATVVGVAVGSRLGRNDGSLVSVVGNVDGAVDGADDGIGEGCTVGRYDREGTKLGTREGASEGNCVSVVGRVVGTDVGAMGSVGKAVMTVGAGVGAKVRSSPLSTCCRVGTIKDKRNRLVKIPGVEASNGMVFCIVSM